ncbi:OmpA family protein [Pedobacter sp. HMF7647]|uniref:OmpA family protein n=1 Tax=Hufsiella arboris TaxID=2695275 RepID=A0A7K1Y8A9_9SPHI|nr:OmpA family protein [Hufsiella arboris]MXV50834.1 OmpA family protein [Hufsiella arboris]
MTKRKLALVFTACFVIYFFPQNIFSDSIEKANKYFEKYDYKFALQIYEKIYAKKPNLSVAEKIADCYRFINDSEKAEQAYAKVLTFPGFDPINYKHYADALKQNGKYTEAKQSYLKFLGFVPSQSKEILKMANACDAAKTISENPREDVKIENAQNLNSDNSDFSPVVSGQSLFFVSDRWFAQSSDNKDKKDVYGWTGNPYLKLYQTTASGEIGAITPMPPPVNDKYHNGPAIFTAKGDTVYFTRTEMIPKKDRSGRLSVGKNAIYMAFKQGSDFSEPKIIIGNGRDYSVQHPAISPDGSILYFSSDMPGGLGGTDIYASRKNKNGGWDKPKNCGSNINTAQDEAFPVVKKDGTFYFSTKGNVGMGGLDLFTAKGSYDKFDVAENMKAPFNSPKDDFGIWFNDDNSGYISSNRNGGKGLDDIYRFSIAPKTPVFAIEGLVVEKESGQPMAQVNISLINKTNGKEEKLISDAAGKFHFNLEPGMDYVVRGDRDKYYSRQEGKVSTKNLKESTVFEIKFELERAKDEFLVRLDNIYYDFDKYNIRKDARPELDKVVAFMSSMPENVKIQLRSHTDSRGPAIYNQWLSQKRAESAVDYLKRSGSDHERIAAIGLGEMELVNGCRDGAKCSSAEHQLNRRTEFKIIRVKPTEAAVNPVAISRNN